MSPTGHDGLKARIEALERRLEAKICKFQSQGEFSADAMKRSR